MIIKEQIITIKSYWGMETENINDIVARVLLSLFGAQDTQIFH